jgi:chromosome segregation ATPase
MTEETYQTPSDNPGNGKRAVAIVGGVLLAALTVSNGYLFVRNSRLNEEIVSLRKNIETEIASLEQRTQRQEEATRHSLEALIQQLRDSQSTATAAADKARLSAQRHAEKLMKTLADLQQRHSEEIATKLDELERESEEKVSAVASEVGVVKTDVHQTKTELEKTIAELRSVRGDMGVMSGLIATNSKELAALRELGDRNYYEFTLTKSKTPQRVGNVALILKKTDAKRNKYSLDLIADDRRVEKKDKYINEPVQFYVNSTRVPLEIVVNQVGKDKVLGYLAVPKIQAASR